MTAEKYWQVVEDSRAALKPLAERVRGYKERLPYIRRVYSLRYIAGNRAMRSNSNGTTERNRIFRTSAWKLHESLASKASQSVAEFDGLRRDVEALVPKLRIVIPAHEIDSLPGKFHPAAIDTACEELLRLEGRVEEFWRCRPQKLVDGAVLTPLDQVPQSQQRCRTTMVGDSSVAQSSSSPSQKDRQTRRRGPDIQTSRDRLDLLDKFMGELTTIHQQRHKFHLGALKQKYPDFELWKVVPLTEQVELITEDFIPKAYAKTLVRRKYGLRSDAVFKKDRNKLKKFSNL